MTKFKFGEGHDDSKLNLEVKSSGDSNLNVETGNLYERSSVNATIQHSAQDSGTNTISGNRNPMGRTQQLNSVLAFATGLILLATILTLVVLIPNPTHAQAQVFAVVLSLAAGGFGSFLSGMLNVRLNLAKRVAIGATGALAVFVIVYFFVPAMAH